MMYKRNSETEDKFKVANVYSKMQKLKENGHKI